MRQILAMTRKEFLLWAQKPGSWIIVFLVPLLFIWIMQAVFGGSGTPAVTVYAVNADQGAEGKAAMEALRGASNLKIDELDTINEAHERVGAGERMAAIVIPEGFSEQIRTPEGGSIQIIIDPARSEQANIVVGLANAALAPLIVDAEISRGVEAGIDRVMRSYEEPFAQPETTPGQDDLQATPQATEDVPAMSPSPEDSEAWQLRRFFSAAMKGIVSSEVQAAIDNPQVALNVQPYELPEGRTVRRPSLLDYLVPGYSLMFVYFLIANLAVTVIEERQTGTLRRLLVAPVPRSRVLLGKMLPYFLIAVVQFVFVLTISRLVFGIDLGNSTLALAVMILASALAMVGIGILIAALAQSEGQADGLAIVLVLAMAVVSGAMFPGIQVPGLQMATPHYWSMQGFLNIISRGQGVEGTLLPAGVLLTIAALCFTIGAIRFRFE